MVVEEELFDGEIQDCGEMRWGSGKCRHRHTLPNSQQVPLTVTLHCLVSLY